MQTYQFLEFGVMRNSDGCFEVDSIHETGFFIQFGKDVSNSVIIKALKRLGLASGCRVKSLSIYGDEFSLFIDHKGAPAGELRLVENEKIESQWHFSTYFQAEAARVVKIGEDGKISRVSGNI